MYVLRFPVILVLLIPVAPAYAQLVINEVCTKNNTVLVDAYGDTPDWIEVRNAGTTTLALDDYYLSDELDEPGKWRLPAMPLMAGEVAVLFSDDDHSGPLYFTFKVAREGETIHLADAGLQVVQTLAVPYLHADHSFGLLDGAAVFFAAPTPGALNAAPGAAGYADAPVFSVEPGFHTGPLVLGATAAQGSTIRYTTDGSDPGPASPVWGGALTLDTTHVVKAMAFADGLLPSEPTMGTYILDAPTGLPVVSLSTHPDTLFDPVLGIYMPGPGADPEFPHWGANFWKDHDIPAWIEFFEADGSRRLVQQVDLETHGGSVARNKPQRPLRLTARKAYGSATMDAPFFPERPGVAKFRSLVLRNSGADFCLANFRDGLFHQVVLHNGLDVDVLAFRPVAVYINGAYWGLMDLRERIDPEHLHHDYGADTDELLLMEEENLSIQGDTLPFRQLLDLMEQSDMNDPAVFAQVAEQLDVASFKDYFATEIHAGNVDWPGNNVKFWKPSLTEGKWRYLMYDLDATMNIFGWIPMDVDGFERALVQSSWSVHSHALRNMLRNDEFRRTFLNRLADLMNTAWTPGHFMHEVDLITDGIDGEIGKHFDRWGQWLPNYEHHAFGLIPEFAAVRSGHVRDQVLQHFDLPNTVTLDLSTFPAAAGDITINTIRPELPFEGVYFHGNAVDLTAHANAGFVFDHWVYSEGAMDHDRDAVVQQDLAEDGTVTAYFRTVDAPLSGFPSPFTTGFTLAVECATAGALEVLVLDAQGRRVRELHADVQPGVQRLDVPLEDVPPAVYMVRTRLNGDMHSVRMVRMM